MKDKIHILVIGHIGGSANLSDGQTVKTRILLEELSRTNVCVIETVDTYHWNERPFKFVLQLLWKILKNKFIIVLLSGNGMRFIFPILFFFSKVFNTVVFHDVIGGNLDQYVEQYPLFKSYLKSFKINWVETEGLKNKIVNLGIENVSVVPNFKRLQIINAEDRIIKKPYKFCTFSRVMPEKGIEEAINAVKAANSNCEVCTLDIYGPIDKDYEDAFYRMKDTFPDYIHYKGVIPYNQSSSILKNYYALLFPTTWVGEGFPGTIIDAFSSGLPVIATDWNCNSEIIENGRNGYIYSLQTGSLTDELNKIISLPSETYYKIVENCIRSAEEYQPEKHIDYIIASIKDN